jgi:hypothetical protein
MGYFDIRVFSLFLRYVSSCFESFLVRFRVYCVFFALVFIFCIKYRSYASFCVFSVGLKQKRSLLELYGDWSQARKEAQKHQWKRARKRREEHTQDSIVTDPGGVGTEAYRSP